MRTGQLVFLVLLATVWMPQRALACVCEREALADSGPTAELAVGRDFERAKVVFVGRMVSRNGVEQHFEVARVLKGETAHRITLHQGEIDAETGTRVLTSCEYEFDFGKEYLVYAFDSGGSLSTSYCSRTRLLERAELDLRLIEHVQRRARSNYRLQRSAHTRNQVLGGLCRALGADIRQTEKSRCRLVLKPAMEQTWRKEAISCSK